MGNLCTWRQGKGKMVDDNLFISREKEEKHDVEKDEEQEINEYLNKINEKNLNYEENKDKLIKASSSIDKIEVTENPKDDLNADDEYSSNGGDTEYQSELDKVEIEKKESDIANMEISKNKRLSVSAEAYGEWNKKKENFLANVYEKDDNEKSKIRKALNESFLFNHLNEKEFETIIDAFSDENVKKGETIINEGDDDGSLLYVIDEGEVEVYKTKDNKKEMLTELKSKDVFGELALLYNSKRAATVRALTDCHLWTLDRESFTYIIKDNIAKKRQMYEDILKQVPLLKDMDPYERSKLSDCLKSKIYYNDDVIITEGDEGNTFYMLIEGNAIATKNDTIIKTYTKGDYFGELALLKNKPRAATIKCQNYCHLVYLDRKSFKRLLGPVEEILNRNVDNYKEVLKQLGLDTTCVEESNICTS